MHETALAQDIINIVTETLINYPDKKLKTVRVHLGEMIAVVPDLLHHSYDALIVDTALAFSKLDLKIIPVSALCNSCKKKFGIVEFEFYCPFCQSPNIIVTSGNEFIIQDLVVDE